MGSYATLSINNTQHNSIKCYYAESRVSCVAMLNVRVISVILLIVIMLSVFMLSVLAPVQRDVRNQTFWPFGPLCK
jgi:hypothetical protein